MPPQKRQKLSDDDDDDDIHANTKASDDDDEFSDDLDSASELDAGPDDEDIQNMRPQKSRQTKKRKLRATAPSNFGATLQSLLNTEAPSTLPLSLKPSFARKRNDEKLELKAKKVLQIEKKEREDRGRIKDVIGGWGGETERALRKVAQRGVVKLFNVIQHSQAEASAIVERSKATRGTGKASLPAPPAETKPKGKMRSKDKDNVLGRGKEVDQSDFFDMIRSGGIVSKV